MTHLPLLLSPLMLAGALLPVHADGAASTFEVTVESITLADSGARLETHDGVVLDTAPSPDIRSLGRDGLAPGTACVLDLSDTAPAQVRSCTARPVPGAMRAPLLPQAEESRHPAP